MHLISKASHNSKFTLLIPDKNLLFNFGEMKNYIFSFLFSEPLNTSQDIYIVSHSAEMIPG